VIIENQGRETVHLLSRHWMITNARGELTEVKGPGVVGEQPVLKPGESFEYMSGAPLNTPSGMMGGAYQMETDNGERFDIEIPTFSLDRPNQGVFLNWEIDIVSYAAALETRFAFLSSPDQHATTALLTNNLLLEASWSPDRDVLPPLSRTEYYSYRSASTGLIAAARRAGSHAESKTTLLTTVRALA
jgi:ApaG protein